MCRLSGWWPWMRRGAAPRLRVFRGAPRHPIAARPGTGLFGPDALAWSIDARRAGPRGRDAADAAVSRAALATDQLAGLGATAAGTPWTDDERTARGADLLGHVIAAGEVFRYVVLTVFRGDLDADARFAASAACLDLVFEDGARLSELARDVHGVRLEPVAQHDGKFLLPDQWVQVVVPLDAARGRVVSEVELCVAALVPGRSAGFADGIEIAAPRPLGARPTDAVRTRRGTHSSERYSRGNTLPAVSTPHALIMATPVTDARTSRWIYAWHAHAGADGRPTIEALATTLAPSPWIGERAAFQVMPSALPTPPAEPAARRLSFRHRDEYDRVHHYRVELDSGVPGASAPIVAELAPARTGVAMRFTLPGGGSLLFDRLGDGEVTVSRRTGGRAGATVTGWVHRRADDDRGLPRMFVWGELDGDITTVGTTSVPFHGDVGWARVEAARGAPPGAAVVELRLGVSFVSLAQARANLAADIGDATFDAVAARAQDAWDEALGAITVEGATRAQRITLASGLVRTLMFPNTAHEITGGGPVHASPFAASSGDTPERTGLRVVSGLLSTNNGYWDTYRTAWPLLGLIDPATPALLDGTLQHARDSGWMSRWSAPGPVDSMVGTSSDAIVADLAVKGIAVDHRTAWRAGIRDAAALPPRAVVGRKGQARALFRSFVSTDVHEGMSWTLEAAINDHALSRYAGWLAERTDDPDERERFLAHAEWLAGRATAFVTLFDPVTGFFRGRRRDGSWSTRTASFDPEVWGGDYVETDAWGMAFTAPHDGAGLAALHGVSSRLADMLGRFFAAPEPGDRRVWGAYRQQIHEMTEARDQRLGQLALSNQPAHHIPAMWAFAGRPHRAHEVIREAIDRLFAGAELGQGNPGDEDNGEMSAWWILNAIGLYPLIPGEPGWFLTPPLFRRVRLRLAGGGVFEITTSGSGRHIAAARVDGEEWASVWLPHARVREGGRLQVELTEEPSEWGAKSRPPSASDGVPRVPVDHAVAARIDGVDAATLVDDDGGTGLRLAAGTGVEIVLDAGRAGAAGAPTLATLTVAGPAHLDLVVTAPTGSLHWRDEVADEVRTIPIRVAGLHLESPSASGAVRVRIENLGDDLDLREVEFLSYEPWSADRDSGFD